MIFTYYKNVMFEHFTVILKFIKFILLWFVILFCITPEIIKLMYKISWKRC